MTNTKDRSASETKWVMGNNDVKTMQRIVDARNDDVLGVETSQKLQEFFIKAQIHAGIENPSRYFAASGEYEKVIVTDYMQDQGFSAEDTNAFLKSAKRLNGDLAYYTGLAHVDPATVIGERKIQSVPEPLPAAAPEITIEEPSAYCHEAYVTKKQYANLSQIENPTKEQQAVIGKYCEALEASNDRQKELSARIEGLEKAIDNPEAMEKAFLTDYHEKRDYLFNAQVKDDSGNLVTVKDLPLTFKLENSATETMSFDQYLSEAFSIKTDHTTGLTIEPLVSEHDRMLMNADYQALRDGLEGRTIDGRPATDVLDEMMKAKAQVEKGFDSKLAKDGLKEARNELKELENQKGYNLVFSSDEITQEKVSKVINPNSPTQDPTPAVVKPPSHSAPVL